MAIATSAATCPVASATTLTDTNLVAAAATYYRPTSTVASATTKLDML